MANRRRKAREQLVHAIEIGFERHGAAQWTNGYRAGNPVKSHELKLEHKEHLLWQAVDEQRRVIDRALAKYTRAVGAAEKHK